MAMRRHRHTRVEEATSGQMREQQIVCRSQSQIIFQRTTLQALRSLIYFIRSELFDHRYRTWATYLTRTKPLALSGFDGHFWHAKCQVGIISLLMAR